MKLLAFQMSAASGGHYAGPYVKALFSLVPTSFVQAASYDFDSCNVPLNLLAHCRRSAADIKNA